MTQTTVMADCYNEPSAELQLMAERYLQQNNLGRLPAEDILSRWCEHLHRQAPAVLELPVLQLVKAVVRAKLRKH
jgi:hypothetical protein